MEDLKGFILAAALVMMASGVLLALFYIALYVVPVLIVAALIYVIAMAMKEGRSP